MAIVAKSTRRFLDTKNPSFWPLSLTLPLLMCGLHAGAADTQTLPEEAQFAQAPSATPALTRHTRGQSNASIDVLQTEFGVTYRCRLTGQNPSVRSQTVWKVYDKRGSLERIIHSSTLSASTLNIQKSYVCQILADDGLFFSLTEASLTRKTRQTLPPVNREERHDMDFNHSFLALRSQLRLGKIGGQSVALCSSGARTLLSAQTSWRLNGQELDSHKTPVLFLKNIPSGELQCRYAAMAWSDPSPHKSDLFEGAPQSLFFETKRKHALFTFRPEQPLSLLSCSTDSPQWICNTESINNGGVAAVFVSRLDPNAPPSQLHLKAQLGSESQEKSIALRTLLGFKRRLQNIDEVEIQLLPSGNTLLCRNSLPPEQLSTAVFLWISKEKGLVQRSSSPLYAPKQSRRLPAPVRCLVVSEDAQTVRVGTSKFFAPDGELKLHQQQKWHIQEEQESGLSFPFRVDVPRSLSVPTKGVHLVCSAGRAPEPWTDKNFCSRPGRVIERGLRSTTMELVLDIPRRALADLPLEPSPHAPSDRFAPALLRFKVWDRRWGNDSAAALEIALLRRNRAPRIVQMTLSKEEDKVRCEASLFDPDHDHVHGSLSLSGAGHKPQLFSSLSQTTSVLLFQKIFSLSGLLERPDAIPPCRAVASDGVLVAKKRVNEGRAFHDNTTALPTTSGRRSRGATTPQKEHHTAREEAIAPSHYLPIPIESFGPEKLTLPSGAQVDTIQSCVALYGPCPQITLEDNQIVLQKTDEVEHGLVFLHLQVKPPAPEGGRSSFLLVLDMFNDGLSKSSGILHLTQLTETLENPEQVQLQSPDFNLVLNENSKRASAAEIIRQIILSQPELGIPPGFAVETMRICRDSSCTPIDPDGEVEFSMEPLTDHNLQLEATLVTPTQRKVNWKGTLRVAPIEGEFQYPAAAQLYLSDDDSQSPTCLLSHPVLETDPQELVFRFYSLNRLVSEIKSYSNQASTSATTGASIANPSHIDSCQVLRGKTILATGALVTSYRSNLRCFVTTTTGWRSTVPCSHTGGATSKRLDFDTIKVDLGNLTASPKTFEAYWLDQGGSREKGFSHHFPVEEGIAETVDRFPREKTQSQPVARVTSVLNKGAHLELSEHRNASELLKAIPRTIRGSSFPTKASSELHVRCSAPQHKQSLCRDALGVLESSFAQRYSDVSAAAHQLKVPYVFFAFSVRHMKSTIPQETYLAIAPVSPFEEDSGE